MQLPLHEDICHIGQLEKKNWKTFADNLIPIWFYVFVWKEFELLVFILLFFFYLWLLLFFSYVAVAMLRFWLLSEQKEIPRK